MVSGTSSSSINGSLSGSIKTFFPASDVDAKGCPNPSMNAMQFNFRP